MLRAISGGHALLRRAAVLVLAVVSTLGVLVPAAGSASAATAAVTQPAKGPKASVSVPAVRQHAIQRAADAQRLALHTKRVKVALRTASGLKGKPYVYGSTGPRSFDCSGFTGYVMRHAGLSLPRTSREQYSRSHKISKADIQPGDLVFFEHGGRVYHVAIYAGHGRIWHARQPGQGVALTRISTSSWVAGRVL
ncbi:cell wall-associated NlpC family hydrolase [Motilibacter rhizosphaerae]|uniref:Cell wall-associated NlpC family hydrolase n=1 Tax=Motilibacter rhizosphaerae TaxID=598652 RepID=A0A4Q7NWQ8_9ACTN|nr:C40 family peptidase [Motilibacter rhizosphaerae]RZS91450.1 cell wall-associated NlpC family hydrolase [Motilibacter rhizosphaerae]